MELETLNETHIEKQIEQQQENHENEDFSSVFEGIGSDEPLMAGSCTGCGNKYFFAIKLAL